jgi:fluoride exporter
MNGLSVGGLAAVGVGAALGAWCRWAIQYWLNPLFTNLMLGTAAANLLGGLLAGFALGLFEKLAPGAVALRLLVLTGFLGSFTTFSALSLELVLLLERREWAWALTTVGTHVVGAVVLAVVGLWAGRALLA